MVIKQAPITTGGLLDPVLSKVFELTLLNDVKSDLISDYLQFGFKVLPQFAAEVHYLLLLTYWLE